MIDFKENLEKILKTYKGGSWDLCYYIYNLMLQYPEEQHNSNFQKCCEIIGTIDTDESYLIPKKFSKKEEEQYRLQWGNYIDELLGAIVKMAYYNHYDSEKFYKILWKAAFCDNNLLLSKKDKAFVLFYIAADVAIPYIEMSKTTPMRMDDKEYKEIIDEYEYAIKRCEYILNFPFDQITECATLLLEELDNAKDEKKRVVLFAQIAVRYMRRGEKRRMLETMKRKSHAEDE